MNARDQLRPHPATGLGLVDVMLVVTILGILAAVAAPMMRGGDLALDQAARMLAADLREAQALAIETRQPLGVRFEPAQNRYRFILADGRTPREAEATLRATPGLAAAEVERLLEARTWGDPALAEARLGSAVFGPGSDLIFDADGTPRQSGLVDLTGDGSWLRLRVQTGTGRIAITGP